MIRGQENVLGFNKGTMTIGASLEVRKKSLKTKQPDFKISDYQWQICRFFCHSFKTSFHHAKKIFVGLVGRRELNYEISHVSESRKRFRIGRQIETGLKYLCLTQRHQLLIFFLVVVEINQRERFECGAELVLKLTTALRNSPDQSGRSTQADNDLVRLGKIVSTQHERFGLD